MPITVCLIFGKSLALCIFAKPYLAFLDIFNFSAHAEQNLNKLDRKHALNTLNHVCVSRTNWSKMAPWSRIGWDFFFLTFPLQSLNGNRWNLIDLGPFSLLVNMYKINVHVYRHYVYNTFLKGPLLFEFK